MINKLFLLTPRQKVLGILLLSILLLFLRLGAVSLFQIAEARNSQCAAEMMQSHNYVVPYFNGIPRTDKPPLHYYFMVLAYYLGGINEGSARFFSAVCGLLVIGATFLVTKRNGGTLAALLTSIILLSSLHVIFQFRLATPDPYLIACHVISLFCFREGMRTRKQNYFLLMYLLWGLAFLTKGPTGVLLPAITVFFFLLATRQLRIDVIKSMLPLWGFLIFLLIATPWFWMVHVETNGEWTSSFFLKHNVGRFSQPLDGHGGPFFLPLAFLLAGMFPFSFLLPAAIIRGANIPRINFRQINIRQINIHRIDTPRIEDWLLLNYIALGVIIVFYSFAATKLINYITPAYPFAAIIIADYILGIYQKRHELFPKLWAEWIMLLLVATAIPIGVEIWMQTQTQFKESASVGWLLVVYPVSFVAGLIAFRKKSSHALSLVAAGSIVVNILFFSIIYPEIDSCGSIKKYKALVQTGKPIVAYQSVNEAFVFYHRKPIAILQSAQQIAGFLKQNPGAVILERSRRPALRDTLPELKQTSSRKDLFSSQYSTFYQH